MSLISENIYSTLSYLIGVCDCLSSPKQTINRVWNTFNTVLKVQFNIARLGSGTLWN